MTTFSGEATLLFSSFLTFAVVVNPYLKKMLPFKRPGRVSQMSWVRYPVWPHTFVSTSADSRGTVVSYWRKYVHEVLVNRSGGLSLPRKSVVRLTDRPDMTSDLYRGPKTTTNPFKSTVQILCIGTDRSQQTMQTKIRLLLKKQSDQGLRCLPFHQHLLDALMQCYIKLFFFKDNYGNCLRCPKFYNFYGRLFWKDFVVQGSKHGEGSNLHLRDKTYRQQKKN